MYDLFVSASEPASVESVPVVGNVMPVLAVKVPAKVYAPEKVTLPPIVIVDEFATPVPPLEAAITVALHVPVVMVPTVAMSVPTNFEAAIEPANIVFVTTPEPIAVANVPAVVVTSPVSAGNCAACNVPLA